MRKAVLASIHPREGIKKEANVSLDQVIQLHISSFELVAGEEGDKLH